MSDTPNDGTAPDEQSGPAQLREALERAKAKVAEHEQTIASLTQAARENEFDKAGVPADGWGKAFRATYEGGLDTEAIRAEVSAWGIPTGQASNETSQPVVPASEAEAIQQVQQMRNEPNVPPNSNFAQEQFERMLASGDFTTADIDRVAADHGLLVIDD